jgi:ORF6N domain
MPESHARGNRERRTEAEGRVGRRRDGAYGVTAGRLNEAVKRNIERFPQDFLRRLFAAEYAALISQIATSKPGRGGRAL